MNTQSCRSYRGFNIDVHVITRNVTSLNGKERRYSVFWTIGSTDATVSSIETLPERLDFLSPGSAFSYGERRAHTFIDGLVGAATDG